MLSSTVISGTNPNPPIVEELPDLTIQAPFPAPPPYTGALAAPFPSTPARRSRPRRRALLLYSGVGFTVLALSILTIIGLLLFVRQQAQRNGPAQTKSTPQAQVMATQETAPEQAVMAIVRDGNESLLLINMSKNTAFPLEQIQLGDADNGIAGSEWGVDSLPPGTCALALVNGTQANPISMNCTEVGRRVIRNASGVFWDEPFDVYYDDQPIAQCETDRCLIDLQTSAPTGIPTPTPLPEQ
jgi:hypothetical protein